MVDAKDRPVLLRKRHDCHFGPVTGRGKRQALAKDVGQRFRDVFRGLDFAKLKVELEAQAGGDFASFLGESGRERGVGRPPESRYEVAGLVECALGIAEKLSERGVVASEFEPLLAHHDEQGQLLREPAV